jgi:hypothetical protein
MAHSGLSLALWPCRVNHKLQAKGAVEAALTPRSSMFERYGRELAFIRGNCHASDVGKAVGSSCF